MIKDKTQIKVDITEDEDRYIAKRVLDKYAHDKFTHDYTCSGMPVECVYDVEGEDTFQINYTPYVAEIKQNKRNPKYVLRAIIKKKKVDDIFKVANGKDMYFISLLEHKTAYIFNMRDIDWKKTMLLNMWQKKRQLEDDEDKIEYYQVPTYLIDYDKAFYKCDITKFYEEYGIHLQTKEEK